MLQTILSITAIVIATGTAGLSFLQWYLEGRRVAVNAYSGTVVGPPVGHRSCLILSVTNHGRIPATVTQWGFDNPREVYTAMPGSEVWSHGPQVPHTLEAGASQVWMLDYHEHKTILDGGHPGSKHRLRGFVDLATGKHKVCRSFIQLSAGNQVPTNSVKRLLKRLLRDMPIAVLILQRNDAERFILGLERPRWRLYTTRVIIDVVLDPQPSRPAQVLPNSQRSYRFWLRRHITIDVPDQFLDIPGAWHRIRWYARRRPHEQRYGIPSREQLSSPASSG